MNFELTKEQKAIQKAVREFAEGEFDKDLALEHEINHRFPRELWQKACELGLVCMYYPEEYGGQEYGLLEQMIVNEELCRKDSGLGIAIVLASFGADLVLLHGSEEMKQRWLPLVTSGKAISCAAFTEPDHGSDITQVGTIALKDGDEWVINGTKMFITNGSIADFAVVLCQTDSNAESPHRGMSTILVETDRPGFEASEVGVKMGLKMTSTAQLTFNNVRVPASNVVGQVNHGFYQTMGFLNATRIIISSQGVGTAQGAFDRALAYAKQRRQFGRRIADFQAIQHKLAEMATKIETARLLMYRAAWAYDQGRIDPKTSSMAKYYSSRIAVEVCEEAVQIFGGYGYMLENEVERFYRDARVTEIYEGTREVQKNTIASGIIGRD